MRTVAGPLWQDDAEVRRAHEMYRDNCTRTRKYSLLTIVPLNLFEQFHRLANTYFLCLVILNWVPQLNVFGKEVSMLPLLLVLSTTLIKDAYEDWRRACADKAINTRCTVRLVEGEETPVQWKEVKVGDVIKVKQDEEIPADLVILTTSHIDSSCFVSTMNLDGETNLKQRRVLSHKDVPSLNAHEFQIICEDPSGDLVNMSGHAEVRVAHGSPSPVLIPIEMDHMALRGTVLRNTKFITGIVVFAGMDTKVMMNARSPPSKRSKLERSANWDVLALIVILLVLCIAGAAGARKFEAGNRSPYFPEDEHSPEVRGVIAFWQYIIVFQVMVPIALYITMEMVKLGQVYFIQQDLDMYDAQRDIPVSCRALNITEDLGQVESIFCDKTGTLTENSMVLHSVSLGGACLYAQLSSSGVGLAHRGSLAEPLEEPLLEARRHGILRAMMLCNTVLPVESEGEGPGSIRFEGESPDEVALVSFAAHAGFKLLRREQHLVRFREAASERQGEKVAEAKAERKEEEAQVLYTLPFDSDRRRMSVLLRERDGRVVLYSKGADSAMFPLCAAASKEEVELLDHFRMDVNRFARAGLRTLVLTRRVVPQAEMEAWEPRMLEAHAALTNRKALLAGAARLLEESGAAPMQALGITGVEDSLASLVPQTISQLQQAGISVWVLTGDKMETAVNIGMASKVIPEDAALFQFEGLSAESLGSSLSRALAECREARVGAFEPSSASGAQPTKYSAFGSRPSSRRAVVVIDGVSLSSALGLVDSGTQESRAALTTKFLDLADMCVSVVCCRSSPSQKAAVVSAYQQRHPDKVTLAIGDGANDVSMIQTAHVGVGISGREGRQASMASDFSISSFRFLAPLLLVHGHWCYSRLARMLPYFFYKNAVFVFLLFWYQLYCGYSTQSALNDWNLILFSFIYTSVPVILSGILDQDVSKSWLLRSPQLYWQGMRGELYNRKVFWVSCILDSLWQSLCMFYIPYLAAPAQGDVGIYEIGAVMMTSAVVIVNAHLALETFHFTWILHAGIWGSVLVYFLVTCAYATSPSVPDFFEFLHVAGKPWFWLVVILSTALALLPRFCTRILLFLYTPSLVDHARVGRAITEKRSSASLQINLLAESTVV